MRNIETKNPKLYAQALELIADEPRKHAEAKQWAEEWWQANMKRYD